MEDLAEDAGPDGGVIRRVGHAADEAADDRLAGVGGVAAGVAGLEEDVLEEIGEAFEVAGGGLGFGRGFKDGLRCRLGDGVEADGGGLAEVHGEVAVGGEGVHGDGEEGVAVA